MTKPDKELLFKTAYDHLKLALHFAEAIKSNPSDSLATTEQFARLVSKANASATAFETAVRLDAPRVAGQ